MLPKPPSPDLTPSLQGLVIRLQAGFFTVQTSQGAVTCQMRGRLKKGRADRDIVAVGDLVEINLQNDGSGSIETVLPRVRALERLAPSPRGDYQQVLLANPDQMVLVFACANPEPHLRMLDRFLVICERQSIPVLIVGNKVDLLPEQQAHDLFDLYPPLGYPVLFTSAAQKIGIESLREQLQGKLSGFAGPSGVGKTSLLNALQPGLGLGVKHVSQATTKGRHSTVVRELHPLDGGGYVADLPGLRSLMLWDIEPEELDGYFPELRSLVEHCQFNDCTHRDEPGCAVRAAAQDGMIATQRYESYLRLRYGEER